MATPKAYTERLVRAYQKDVLVTWTVPAGHRAVIRSIVGANLGGGPAVVRALASGYYVAYLNLAANSTGYVETRVVAYAGDAVQAICDALNTTIIVTGYLFADPAVLRRAPGETRADLPLVEPSPDYEIERAP